MTPGDKVIVTQPTKFEARHNYGYMVKGKKIVGHIDFGGDDLRMPCRTREIPFEMHYYFGPIPLNKKTREALTNIPGVFWDAYERWELGGMFVDGDLCVVPEWCGDCRGQGDELRHLGGRHYELVGKCKACNGARVRKLIAYVVAETKGESK